MKKIVLIILALTLVVISCKKKDDELTGPGGSSGPGAVKPEPNNPDKFEFYVKNKTFGNGIDNNGHLYEEDITFSDQGVLKFPTWYDPKTEDYLKLYKCIYSDSTIAVYYGQQEVEDDDGNGVLIEFVEGFKLSENGGKLTTTNPTEGILGTLTKDDVKWDFTFIYTLKVN